MKSVLSAESAVFVHFKTIRIVLLVFHCVIVSLLALCALQCDFCSHIINLHTVINISRLPRIKSHQKKTFIHEVYINISHKLNNTYRSISNNSNYDAIDKNILGSNVEKLIDFDLIMPLSTAI